MGRYSQFIYETHSATVEAVDNERLVLRVGKLCVTLTGSMFDRVCTELRKPDVRESHNIHHIHVDKALQLLQGERDHLSKLLSIECESNKAARRMLNDQQSKMNQILDTLTGILACSDTHKPPAKYCGECGALLHQAHSMRCSKYTT